jgi:hypothetical protein
LIYPINHRAFAKKPKGGDKKDKKAAEKDQIKEEFAEVDTDDIKLQFNTEILEVIEGMED